ncbi:receptor protein-tyrosine kinase [Elysia marginata]|uniref:Receptor protein-tyrosine kinase n=1 Tax=Elysia marginata TaxID=1093978 RepID=A0AAV4I892_9GAST|nr:receptor protein-tyrosine kinase [Elysia marginata]
MRLPSASYDQQEFLQGITSDAGEDTSNLVEADDYLHPGESGGRGRRAGPGGPHMHLNGGVNHHHHHHHHPHAFTNGGLHNGRVSPPRRQHSSSSTSSTAQIIHDPHSPLTNGALVGKSGSKGNNSNRRDGQKGPNKKYMHLNAAARAKQERENPHIGGNRLDSASSRYCSDPIKFSKDREEIEWGSQMSPYPYPGADAHNPRMPKKTSPSIKLPVDKDDYLQPGAAAQSMSYLDLDGKGYYQNEKIGHPNGNAAVITESADTTATEDDPMLDTSTTPLHSNGINHNNNNKNKRGQYTNQMSSKGSGVFSWPAPVSSNFAVDNPDYFEDQFQAGVTNLVATEDDELDDDVWEVQEPAVVPNGTWNGYLPVANSCNSPSHAAHPVNTKVMYNGGRALRNSESNV